MNNKMLQYINSFRKIKAASDFRISFLSINIFILIILFITIIIESIFYLEPQNRYAIISYILSFYFILCTYIILKYYFNYKNLFNNTSNTSISKLIGIKFTNIKDRLINAYQLETQLDKNNPVEYELSKYAINEIKTKLDNLVVSFNKQKMKTLLRKFYLIIILFGFVIILFNSSMLPAITRIMNPHKKFNIPQPFNLINLTDNKHVLEGDDKEISIVAIGEIPDSIALNYKIEDKLKRIYISSKKEIFNYKFQNIQENIVWWGNVYPTYFLSPWDNIQSKQDTIIVIKRPIISNLEFIIEPPNYTDLRAYTHPANMTNINLPLGSNVIIKGSANKKLTNAWALINDNKHQLEVEKNNMFGNIILMEQSKIAIICQDNNYNASSTPIYYNFNILADMPPSILMTKPDYEFELDETNQIQLNIQLSDDYGFSALWIEYIIKKPSYLGYQDTNTYIHEIPKLNKNVKVQSIDYQWDISLINLSPEDEIHFLLSIADNNDFSANISKSQIFIGKYPTLEDLFNQMEAYEEEIDDYNEEIISNVDEVQELVEELQLDLLKSDELGWEEKQEIDKTLEEMENIFNQIDEIQEIVEKIEEQVEKNNLISDDLIQKYDEFQNLLDTIITPELLEAMEKMQKFSENMDLTKLLEEINNFEYDLEIFEEQLDRFIDMFEQAIAEQKIDELIKKLETIFEEQSNILNSLNKKTETLKELSSKERKIEEQYNNLQNIMEEAKISSGKSSESTSSMIKELINSELNNNTTKDIKNTRESLQKNQEKSSKENAESSKNDLSEMLKKTKEIQENFQQETVTEMLNEFFSVVNSILNISQYQDDLITSSSGVRSNSPKLPSIAKQQNKIKLQNEQLMKQILSLSRKTFYITPPMIRSLGKSSLAMNKSISYFEQKKSSQALIEQKTIISGLNETAYMLLHSMEEMMSSGSASGFESFMKQLEQLSNQQEGINQGTMQLPQLGMGGQQNMMQQLQQQQEALKKGLQQLLNDMPGSENTGLGQANKEMEDVVNDFKRKQVNRRTQEKQQRILSRMLDSQKSLTQKDFSNKRKSETPLENIIYNSPDRLPDDKGQQELLLINAMESALREGYSKEYQEIIKLYFYNLQEQTNNND